MRKLWIMAGRITYILAWPGLYLILRNSQRTRVIVQADDKILVLKDWLGDGKWKLPGGGIHKGESVVDSARRELLEETGIDISADQLTAQGMISAESRGSKLQLHIFSLTLPSQPTIKRQKLEIIDSSWQSVADLINQPIASDNTIVILRRYHPESFD